MSPLPVHPPEWIDTAPLVVHEHIEIRATPNEVWQVIADHERWTEWFTELDGVEVLDGRERVGGHRQVRAGGVVFTEEFTAWDPGRRFAFAVVRVPLLPLLAGMAERVDLTESDVGCRVDYWQGLQARRGLGGVLERVWRNAPDQVRRALEGLQRICESEP